VAGPESEPGGAEGRYRELVEAMPAATYVAVPEGDGRRTEFVSPQILDLAGVDAAAWTAGPAAWTDRIHPSDRERVAAEWARAVAAGEPFRAEYRLVAPDGRATWVRDRARPRSPRDGGPAKWQGFLADIGDFKAMEAQFLQAQKMEAVGRLAAGVAHDFNNVLTVITGYGHILAQRLSGDERARVALEQIHKAADKAGALTRQLLAFSRRHDHHPVVVDLVAALRDLEPMVRRVLGDRVEVVLALDAGAEAVMVDRAHLDQAVMNLAVNARDAMPEGGRLTLRTRLVDLDAEYVRRHVGVPPGRYACLTVADTGCGMDEQTVERIFEPFFTTKAEGRGTGLGLSTVYAVVHRAGGHIETYSAPGRGTTFKVYLPLADPGAAAPTGATPPPGPGAAAAGPPAQAGARPRGGTVLLVEDQEPVRALARTVLAVDGYEILEAGGVEEALRIARGARTIDVALCDVGLPDGSGETLAARLREVRPTMAILIVTGGAEEAVSGTHPRLSKPFTAGALRAAVAALLPPPLTPPPITPAGKPAEGRASAGGR